MQYVLTTTIPEAYAPECDYFRRWPDGYVRTSGDRYGQKDFSSPTSNNLGDVAASVAAKSCLQQLGIAQSDVAIESLYHMSQTPCLSHEKRIYVVFGPGQITSSASFRPPTDPSTHLLFFGIALLEGTWEILGNDSAFISLMKRNEPIGCRDFGTINFLRSLGVKAFFAGCFSMLFPSRPQKQRPPHIFGIDLYPNVKSHIPNELLENFTETSNTPHFETPPPHEHIFQLAFDRYAMLRDSATLVITRKIHIAMPCAAMGIPVVFIHEHPNDSRVSVIKSILPFYSADCLDSVDWQPEPSVKAQEQKKRFLKMFKCRLQQVEGLAGAQSHRLSPQDFKEADAMIAAACQTNIDQNIHRLEDYSRKDFMKRLFGHHLPAVTRGERKVVLYGVGSAGKRIGLMLKYCGFENFCFSDSKAGDEEEHSWNEIPVISAKRLREQYSDSLVVITSKTYYSEIAETLRRLGFGGGQVLDSLPVIDKYATFHVPYAPVKLYFGV